MTQQQQDLLGKLDAFHGQAKTLILHGGAPTGAAAGTFNLQNFLKNAISIFQVVWPIVQPFILAAGAAPTSPDPAVPTKAT